MRDAENLSLFPVSEIDIYSEAERSRIKWSYSRRTLLEQCPRRYYYEYYGSSTRVALSEPQKARLQSLKRLKNRHTRSGQILHAVIAGFFRRVQQGEMMSPQALGSWAEKMLNRDITFSRSPRVSNSLEIENDGGPAQLQEFYYHRPDAERLYSETRERLLNALRNFASQDVFAWCRAVGMDSRALIETTVEIPGLPCRGESRLDLAYQGDDGVDIVDWKLGTNDGGTDSLQLGAYALWACHTFESPPASVHTHKAFLGSGRLATFPITEHMLRAARARIVQDVVRMQLLDPYGREGVAEAFTPCAQPKVCTLCPYQEVCPVGRLLVDA